MASSRLVATRQDGESLRRYLLRVARTPLRRMGFDIRRVDAGRRETLGQAIVQLRRMGLRPATVIDLGAAGGTPELYDVFDDAHHLMIEPIAEWEPALKRILGQVRGEYALCAVASQPGTVTLRIPKDPEAIWHATMFPRAGTEAAEWVERSVSSVRLDDLVAERGVHPPFLVKADVEGYELDALAGGEATLEQTQAAVLEIHLLPMFEGGPSLAEVVDFMTRRGFVACDIVGGHNRESDGRLIAVDMVFIREE